MGVGPSPARLLPADPHQHAIDYLGVRWKGASRLEAHEEMVTIIAGNQIEAGAWAHCHDNQPECAALVQKR